MGGSEGGDSMLPVKKVWCSVGAFNILTFLWGVLSLVLFILGLMGLVSNIAEFLLFQEDFYIGLTVFSGLSFFVVILGLVGSVTKVEIFFIFHLFLMGFLLLAQSLAVIFFFLYINEVGTIDDLDAAATGVEASLAAQLENFAREENQEWIKFQDRFECCGVFLDSEFEGADLDAIESGAVCTDNATDILSARNALEAGGNIEDQAAVASLFCVTAFVEFIQDNTPLVATSIVFVLLLQFFAIVAGCRMYWVPHYRGGWAYDDEELRGVAEEKGLKMPEQEPPTSAFGSIKNATERLSFRVKNAMTANPNVPQNSGLFQRFSMRNSSAVASGQFSQRGGFGMPGRQNFEQEEEEEEQSYKRSPMPPSAPPPWSKRVSQKMSQGFASMGNAFKRSFKKPMPPGPPPGNLGNNGGGGGGFGMPGNGGPPPPSFGAPPMGMPQGQGSGRLRGPPGISEGIGFNNRAAAAPIPPPKKYTQPPLTAPAPGSAPAPKTYTPSKKTAAPKKTKAKKTKVKKTKVKKAKSKAKSPMAGGGGAPGGLLAQIQKGKQLNHTVTDDRSAPKI